MHYPLKKRAGGRPGGLIRPVLRDSGTMNAGKRRGILVLFARGFRGFAGAHASPKLRGVFLELVLPLAQGGEHSCRIAHACAEVFIG